MSKFFQAYHWVIQPLIVILILAFGFIGAMSFSLLKESPEKSNTASFAPLVRVLETSVSNDQIVIEGNGTLQARTRINIAPQVGGRISYVHPGLRAGGVFKANDVLLKIEQIEYQLAVTQQEAEVAQAKTTLQLEKAEAEASRQEWREIHPDKPIPTLVSREPQIAEAEASLKSAEAKLALARLDLNRTQLKLPFDGRVVESFVDIGEIISSNQDIAIVYDSGHYEVTVPMNLEQLNWIEVSDNADDQEKYDVSITINIGENAHKLKGKVVRIESELEELSRFARIIVSLSSDSIPEKLKPKILPGLFVNVSIDSHQFAEVTTLPRASLRHGNMLWTIEDGKLKFTEPNIVYKTDSVIFVNNLKPGTKVIMSDLSVVTEGMGLRVSTDS
ncbi:MAG: efflux RND transporter periplasmic adaptor subunit [Pseudomonadota bacterium]